MGTHAEDIPSRHLELEDKEQVLLRPPQAAGPLAEPGATDDRGAERYI